MLDGLFAGASALDSAASRLDAAAENLANASTPGFKRSVPVDASFEALLAAKGGARAGRPPLVLARTSTARDLTQGAPRATGAPLDVMIRGDGFLAVETPRGVRYTRSGSLAMAEDGTLVTKAGARVLGEGGSPIRLDPAGPAPAIERSGEVKQGDASPGKLRIVDFPRPYALSADEGGLYSVDGGAAREQPAAGAEVIQGTLEDSNVDVVKELVDMIHATRLFEASGNVVKTQDRSLDSLMRTL